MEQEFLKSSSVCLKNAQRLLAEAQLLEFEKPPATRNFLSIIAQEECAKGFLLYLISIKAISWNKLILRATRDHICKQLVGVVMDFLTPDDDQFFKRLQAMNILDFPNKVADAIDILRYEKIGRWESSTWVWDEDPKYDETPLLIAEGKRDKEKQQSLYVEISKTGDAVSTPYNVTDQQADYEYEKGMRFERFLGRLVKGENPNDSDFKNVTKSFKSLFSKQS